MRRAAGEGNVVGWGLAGRERCEVLVVRALLSHQLLQQVRVRRTSGAGSFGGGQRGPCSSIRREGIKSAIPTRRRGGNHHTAISEHLAGRRPGLAYEL